MNRWCPSHFSQPGSLSRRSMLYVSIAAPVLVEFRALEAVALVVVDEGRAGVGIGRPVQQVGIRVHNEGVQRGVAPLLCWLSGSISRVVEFLPEEADVQIQ